MDGTLIQLLQLILTQAKEIDSLKQQITQRDEKLKLFEQIEKG